MKNNIFFELTVKAVIINELGHVLVLKRSKSDKAGPRKYDLPGGRIEEGENIKECLLREIKEELGDKVEVEIDSILYAFDFPKKYEKKINLNKKEILIGGKGLRFLMYYRSGKIELSDEHEKFEWLKINEAIEKFSDDDFERDKKEAIIKAQKYLEMKNSLEGWKRCMADFENYKKRQMEERRDMITFSNTNLILEIFPILDNFYASTEHIPEDQKENPWVIGIMYIQKQLEKVLEDNGVNEISVKAGDEFDPNIMEAIKQESENSEQESKNKKQDKVKKVLMKGYKIGPARNASHSDAGGGKVIRATKVVVE